uniref:PDZ domain-containing protein n=1 Tax=Timema bartmani TaxID=61472 RepID=A0A7R9EXW4_9NEOP|nr:unnamed protein product [Timema bartmani]
MDQHTIILPSVCKLGCSGSSTLFTPATSHYNQCGLFRLGAHSLAQSGRTLKSDRTPVLVVLKFAPTFPSVGHIQCPWLNIACPELKAHVRCSGYSHGSAQSHRDSTSARPTLQSIAHLSVTLPGKKFRVPLASQPSQELVVAKENCKLWWGKPALGAYVVSTISVCEFLRRQGEREKRIRMISAVSCTHSSIMKRTNPQGMVVNLRRGNVKTPWGIRIVGGVDLDTPFVVTRVQAGSPADGELQRGDLIKKIGDYDARDLRHEDAQNLFKSAGNTISLAVKRSVEGQTFAPTYAPFQESVGGGAATTFSQEVFQNPSTSTLNKSASVVFPPPLPSSHPNLARPHSTTLLQTWANPEEEDSSLSNQVQYLRLLQTKRDEEGIVLEIIYPHCRKRRVRKKLGKTTLSRPDYDSNLDLPVINRPVQRESDATEAEYATRLCRLDDIPGLLLAVKDM